MDLSKAWVGQSRAAFVGTPDGRRIASFSVGRKVKHITVAASTQDYGVSRM